MNNHCNYVFSKENNTGHYLSEIIHPGYLNVQI